jgi:hypothetical protein
MIATADANKGATDTSGTTPQRSPASAQSNQATFRLILSMLDPQGTGEDADVSQPLFEASENSGDTESGMRDPAAERALSAIFAAWLVEKGGRVPALQEGYGPVSEGGNVLRVGLPTPGAVQGLGGDAAGTPSLGSPLDHEVGIGPGKSTLSGVVNESALAAALMAAVNIVRPAGSGSDSGPGSSSGIGSALSEGGGSGSAASLAAAFLASKPDSAAVSIAAAAAFGVDAALFVKGRRFDAPARALLPDGSEAPAANRGVLANAELSRSAAQSAVSGLLVRTLSVHEEGRSASRSGQEAVAERAGEGADSQDRATKFAGDAFNPRFSELLGAESRVRAQLESSDALLASSGSAAQASAASQPQPLALLAPARETLANARALEGSVSWLASHHGGSATIDLVPPELGSLRIELKVDAAGASATLVVHAASDVARVAVEQALDRLYEAFQGSGMSLSVSVGSGSSSFRGGMSGAKEGGSREEGNLGVRSSAPSPELEGTGRSARTAGIDVLSLYA